MTERYWLKSEGEPWHEASEGEFIEAERNASFIPKSGEGTATNSFFTDNVQGRTTSGEITEELYGLDPEFLRDVKASDHST